MENCQFLMLISYYHFHRGSCFCLACLVGWSASSITRKFLDRWTLGTRTSQTVGWFRSRSWNLSSLRLTLASAICLGINHYGKFRCYETHTAVWKPIWIATDMHGQACFLFQLFLPIICCYILSVTYGDSFLLM